MKLFKKILISGLLLTSFVAANDSTLTNKYPLLTDMKMAKEEQLILSNINALITDRKHNNREKVMVQKKLFSTIINGLSKGNSKLKIHGTKVQFLKLKIATIQLLWQHENTIIDSAINNKMYEKDACDSIEKLSSELSELNKLYKQSYARYKKNSAMKSLVSSYMKKEDKLINESMYAMNTVK